MCRSSFRCDSPSRSISCRSLSKGAAAWPIDATTGLARGATQRELGWRRRALLVIGFVCALGGVTATGLGCGTSEASKPAPVSTVPPTTIAMVQTLPGWGPPDASVQRALGLIRAASRGLKLYLPAVLPAGTVAPERWWPVSEVETPSLYSGPVTPNPRITDRQETGPEIQLVLESPSGWLEILENVRGDLGDVSGALIGEVSGRPATLYEMSGASCVQWSDAGVWYAVFTRGWSDEELRVAALSMRPFDGP